MRPSHHHHPRSEDGHRHHFGGGRGFGRRGHDRHDEPGEGRGGRRRVFDSSELRLVLLKLIADQPRHGYEMIRAIEELTGGRYAPSPGMVYPTLTLLVDMGHTAEVKSDGSRKAFSVTEDGTAYLADRKQEVEALFARLAELGAQREPTDAAPIRRAMTNLRAVLMHRLGRADLQTATLHEAVAIIDDAAQRIERL